MNPQQAQQVQKTDTKTLVIDKFNGRLTRYRDGDCNSGMANFYASWGYDTFQQSGTLTFLPAAVDITGGVITDLIMAGKVRVEGSITFVYAIGHTGRLYKIQVNDISGKNPDYDVPVLLTTLANSQTFRYGASLDFFQPSSTEYIYIGHDTGITRINFDGTGETNSTAGWINNVPRQQVNFTGKQFFTNGANLSYIDSTGTINHNAINPGFPANMQARDLRLTADGRYIVTAVTRNPIGDMTSTGPNPSDIAAMPSSLIYWNGTDIAASSMTSFPAFTTYAYYTFAQNEYIFGQQIGGQMLCTPQKVLLIDEFTTPPIPNAIACSGDFVGWANTTFNFATGHTNALISVYGTIDSETPIGHYRQLIKASTLTNGDVVRVPLYMGVSMFEPTGSSSGYTTPPFQEIGAPKVYFSTLEYNGTTTSYGFWKFKAVEDYLSSTGTGVYETQHQIFSKKISVNEYRVYLEPPAVPAYCSFTIDLIGINGAVLTGSSFTFSSANQITSTQDRVKYNPSFPPTSVLGVRITNVGPVGPLIHRIEVDYSPAGN